MTPPAGHSAAFQTAVPNFRPTGDSLSSLSVHWNSVHASSPPSQWLSRIGSRLSELVALQRGWDGYDGLPVDKVCAIFSAILLQKLWVPGLPDPQLVPGTDGSVQIEWHINGIDLEVDVLAPYSVHASYADLKTGRENEIETDFTQLAQWVAALSQGHQDSPNDGVWFP